MQSTHNAMLHESDAIPTAVVTPPTLQAIDAAMAAEASSRMPRGHLGMSQIGHGDMRTLWLRFRWSLPDTPAPRTLRIFQLGNAIEAELARFCRQAGFELHTENPETGGQFNFSYLGGHFAGSMDGCIRGIPEALNTWHVWEAKSVSHKRFADLSRKGVKDWSHEYYAQLQSYMGATGMSRALFMAYDKDTSELYVERVREEPMAWEAILAKAERVITDYDMPESGYRDRTWFEAKFMGDDAQAVYWGDRLPKPNCRNCRFSEAVIDEPGAKWYCHWRHAERTIPEQHAGCDEHQFIVGFMAGFADAVESNQPLAMYRHKRTGQLFANGLGDHGADWSCYTSAELHVIKSPIDVVTDPGIDALKETFPAARVITRDSAF